MVPAYPVESVTKPDELLRIGSFTSRNCELASVPGLGTSAIICFDAPLFGPFRQIRVTRLLLSPMNLCRHISLTAFLCLASACSQEPPPRSVSEFLDDPLLLEAALVRCTQDRNATRYAAECISAREAVKQIEAKEEAERRAAMEAQSQRKRDALRRTQQAVAEARRRVVESERLRKEAEYLAQFGQLPPDDSAEMPQEATNAPMAEIPEAIDEDVVVDYVETVDSDGSNAPLADTTKEVPTDLDTIREELRRRNDSN